MTIGELMAALRKADGGVKVYYDFAGCAPTKVASSRGDYALPALGWCATGYSGQGQAQTVAELITELEVAVSGMVYVGWKGGKYAYKLSDTLCVDNPGDWTDTHIVGVEDLEHEVIVHTKRY